MLRERVSAGASVDGELALPFELRRRSRLLTRLVGGTPVGLMLERGAPLRDGECLRGDDGRLYRVLAAMVRGLGAAVTALRAPFEPEAGAYASGAHTHGADGHYAPVIHDHHEN